MEDSLVEIDRRNWTALRDLYSPENPESYLSYSLLDNYIRWSEHEPESVDITFYSLNGDYSDGTFLGIWKSKDNIEAIIADSLADSISRLVKLILLLEFSKKVYFKSLTKNALNAVLEAIKLKNLGIGYRETLSWYHLSRSKALNIQITPPEGITLKPIAPADVPIIDEEYPHPFPRSLKTFQTMARLNPSVGAFNADGRLVAWALRWSRGTVGALQVVEEYRRRGLGELVTRAISRKVAELGYNVCAGITVGNTPSEALFEKLGFTCTHHMYNIRTLPTDSRTN